MSLDVGPRDTAPSPAPRPSPSPRAAHVVDPHGAPARPRAGERVPRPLVRRLVDGPADAGRLVLAAVVLSLGLQLVWWWLLADSGGDIAAQDAWAEFARSHPGSAYNLAWYGGMHPVSYSVLSPYLMALLGVRSTMILAATGAGALFAWLVASRLPTGRQRWWPVLGLVVALFGNSVSGRVTFVLGTMFALAALCVVFAWPTPASTPTRAARRRRGLLAAVSAALATAASPVAGLFLGLVAATLWVARRPAASYALGVPPVLVVAGSSVLFPFSGRQPMAWNSAVLPVIAGLCVVLLVPRSWRLLRAGGALYVLFVLLAWLVPSPIGTNISRLGLIFGGAVLLAAACDAGASTSWLARRVGRRLAVVGVVIALLTSASWQVATAARDAVTTRAPEAFTTDLDPLLAQLRSRGADQGRVEVVPTRSHREASAIAPYLPLARGWNRQADAERNALFYADAPLTGAAYREWLHRWAVRFVVLSTGDPDPAAVEEARLIRRGLPFLTQVWSDADWQLYEVSDPTPLVSAPARVVSFDAGGLVLTTPRAARIIVRIPASPWLSLVDSAGDPLPGPKPRAGGVAVTPPAIGPMLSQACLTDVEEARAAPGADGGVRDNWVIVDAPAAGQYRLGAPYRFPRGSECPRAVAPDAAP
ncbi:MFS transporter [Nocardioides sp. TRM66260-LWL]|uniref:MFS transporter n=1 Tax=Nocardioides sp. TRM66260-LWL TaxID=2874478 RepID=UPI001CC5F97E|nr:MFS transporter [Nocardioides sp. TRM66260-LWL]MBZ5735935.1 MFS transporter [Nocardioides sp. TRM66260-LWL]